MKKVEREFEQVNRIVNFHWERAIGVANLESLLSYWSVGRFLSSRLKAAAWGSKTIEELSDYLQRRNAKLRGYGKRQLYNMVEFYETYTSEEFTEIFNRLKLDEFVQLPTAQLALSRPTDEIVQLPTAQLDDMYDLCSDFPMFLTLTTFTNHIEILNHCRRMDERVFYVLYCARERLKQVELRRCFANQTFDSVMSREKQMSPRLKSDYPGAEFMLKDKALLEFLRLPKKHTEPLLHKRLVAHMKEFVLELGKDFLYMGDEYHVHVGGEEKRLDLLFYHRGLRCLVDVELKSVAFEPEHVGKTDMYLEAIDREIRREGENPSVGIILCPVANKCRVAYTLNRTMSPVLVAEYRRQLVPEEIACKSLEEYCAFLKREEIARTQGARQ